MTNYTENWTWADELFWASDWADLVDIDDAEFIPETGSHVYQCESGQVITVTPAGDVVLGYPEN